MQKYARQAEVHCHERRWATNHSLTPRLTSPSSRSDTTSERALARTAPKQQSSNLASLLVRAVLTSTRKRVNANVNEPSSSICWQRSMQCCRSCTSDAGRRGWNVTCDLWRSGHRSLAQALSSRTHAVRAFNEDASASAFFFVASKHCTMQDRKQATRLRFAAPLKARWQSTIVAQCEQRSSVAWRGVLSLCETTEASINRAMSNTARSDALCVSEVLSIDRTTSERYASKAKV